MTHARLLRIAAGALACAASLATAAPLYHLTDITPPGTQAWAADINANGVVVGTTTSTRKAKVFVYRDGESRFVDGGGENLTAWSINRHGSIACDVWPGACVYQPGTGFIDIGTLGGSFASSNAINDKGHVAGSSQDALGHLHAFRWAHGVMTDLGLLGPYAEGTSIANGINARGDIVGTSDTVDYDAHRHAFVHRKGRMIDLGTLGGTFSEGTAINDQGHVTGNSNWHKVQWHALPFIHDGHRMRALGNLGGNLGMGLDINNHDDVVGWSTTVKSSGEEPHVAFVFTEGTMFDLNTLLDGSGAGWQLTEAHAINDAGQIAGQGLVNGQLHAFLLTPVVR